jgi:signal transduction histidine kinase
MLSIIPPLTCISTPAGLRMLLCRCLCICVETNAPHNRTAHLNPRFRSLRIRLVLPLLCVAVLAAVGVAVFSYWLGDRWATEQTATRYQGISKALAGASFPLNRQVVGLLANLTRTELITISSDGQWIESSLDLGRDDTVTKLAAPPVDVSSPQRSIVIGGRLYRFGVFARSGIAAARDGADRVAVLFDGDEIRASRWRAAGLPLATGMSTILLLASVTLYLAERLVARLARLQRDVNRIAEGNFDAEIQSIPEDEIGSLGRAVKEMSGQLKQTWATLHRQESEKLLHQLAGGLAHQLRNSITGARMAVELHSTNCPSRDDDSLSVALSQLEQTEDHVRRLLLVAAGKQDRDRVGSVKQCLADLGPSLNTTAKHLNVALSWQISEDIQSQRVADTPSLAAAVSNLVINAMQAAENVQVEVRMQQPTQIRIDVVDDGPGLPADIADKVFDPFVTSKPEGLGLGLPLVKRSAERLAGRVKWQREHDRTRFILFASTC